MAPIVPDLKTDDDSSNFSMAEDDKKHEQGTFEPATSFEGNHLCFAGFSYCREYQLLGEKSILNSERVSVKNSDTEGTST